MLYKILLIFSLLLTSSFTKEKEMSIYDFTVKNIDEKDVSLSKYKGKVLLIVNVASKCGFTPQYEGLEKLYDKYKNDNFMILGFPSNQFSNQEPGSNKEIKEFCQLTYGVSFDMFAKTTVNGPNANPLYKFLKGEKRGFLWTEGIKWNFTKFLVDTKGNIIKRYAPATTPMLIKKDILQLLKNK